MNRYTLSVTCLAFCAAGFAWRRLSAGDASPSAGAAASSRPLSAAASPAPVAAGAYERDLREYTLPPEQGDGQKGWALRDLAVARYREWLAADPDAAAAWLVANGHRITPAMRAALGAAAAETAPEALLRHCSGAGDSAVFLELLSRALGGVKKPLAMAAEETRRLFTETLGRHMVTREHAFREWTRALVEEAPGDVVKLIDTEPDAALRARLALEVAPRLARRSLREAVDLLRKTGAEPEPHEAGVMLGNTGSRDFPLLVEFLGGLKDRANTAGILAAMAGHQWEPEGQKKLLDWAMTQDDVTRHAAVSRLLPGMGFMGAAAQQAVADTLWDEESVERAVSAILLKSGEVDAWLPWAQARGGLTGRTAQGIEGNFAASRPEEFERWKTANPGKSLAEEFKRRK